MEDAFMEAFKQFDNNTQQALFAALWAGMDVHAPLDSLSEAQYLRLKRSWPIS